MPMRLDQSRSSVRRRRRGSLTLELLLVLPILLVILLATVEFASLLQARQQLLGASREGARVAALGGDESAVEAAVRRALGSSYQDAITIRTVLRDSAGLPVVSGAPVLVHLEIPANAAAPDLLRLIGFTLQGEEITAVTTMRKE